MIIINNINEKKQWERERQCFTFNHISELQIHPKANERHSQGSSIKKKCY